MGEFDVRLSKLLVDYFDSEGEAMSRWQELYETHPFRASWSLLQSSLKELATGDVALDADILEIARANKVVAYLDVILQATDPELIPQNSWDKLKQQTDACVAELNNYKSNNTTAHLQAANTHVDSMLTTLRPHMVSPADFAAALRAASEAHGQSIKSTTDHTIAYLQKVLKDIQDSEKKTRQALDSAEKKVLRLEGLEAQMIGESAEADSLRKRLTELEQHVLNQASAIGSLHAELFTDTAEKRSTSSSIRASAKEIQDAQQAAHAALTELNEQSRELKEFHTTIFGQAHEGKDSQGGLKAELEKRLQQLGELENTQTATYQALNERIEKLLPGATSAGLATAYKEMREQFSPAIKTYTLLFYGSLAFLAILTFLSTIETFNTKPFSITFFSSNDLPSLARTLLQKMWIIIPLTWLALFSANRRNQYERLQQEYAHKQTLASSYESYKKQLDEIGEKTSDLRIALISRAIDAIAFNASTTLDGKNLESTPFEQILKRVNVSDLKKLEAIKGAPQ